MQESKLYINVIIESIEKIERSMENINYQDFLNNSNLQDATLMRLQFIGENIKKIPLEIKNKNKRAMTQLKAYFLIVNMIIAFGWLVKLLRVNNKEINHWWYVK
jgi:uncharacterized protein with HEPN domain